MKKRTNYICMLVLLCAAMLCASPARAADGVAIPLTVKNTVTGGTPAKDETFTFVLEAETKGAPMPEKTEMTITGSGEARFGDIAFTSAGQYRYKLYEQTGSASGYKYDDTVYHVLVDASWQAGKLVTQVVAWKGDVQSEEAKVAELAFENKYSAPSSKMYTIMSMARQGGSISPAGSTSVAEGESLSFIIKAESGYKISDVLIDGESIGAVSAYTFTNVTADHLIVAVFEKEKDASGIDGGAGDSGDTVNKNNSTGAANAKTGDETNPAIWLSVAVVALLAAVMLSAGRALR